MFFRGVMTTALMPTGPDAQHLLDQSSMKSSPVTGNTSCDASFSHQALFFCCVSCSLDAGGRLCVTRLRGGSCGSHVCSSCTLLLGSGAVAGSGAGTSSSGRDVHSRHCFAAVVVEAGKAAALLVPSGMKARTSSHLTGICGKRNNKTFGIMWFSSTRRKLQDTTRTIGEHCVEEPR